MKNIFIISCLVLFLNGCSPDKPDGLILHGTIDGLKVGTVYLQKLKKDKIVNLDSVVLDGNSTFTLKTSLEEPQLLYVYLNKKDASIYDDRIAFFATDTIMTFSTSLYNFEKEAVFTGGESQKTYQNFLENSEKLNEAFTQLLKREMTLQSNVTSNPEELAKLDNEYNALQRKKILYSLNFANNNINSVVAPYLLLQEKESANPKLLDSIFKLMPKKIQSSLYGKELSEFLKKSKN